MFSAKTVCRQHRHSGIRSLPKPSLKSIPPLFTTASSKQCKEFHCRKRSRFPAGAGRDAGKFAEDHPGVRRSSRELNRNPLHTKPASGNGSFRTAFSRPCRVPLSEKTATPSMVKRRIETAGTMVTKSMPGNGKYHERRSPHRTRNHRLKQSIANSARMVLCIHDKRAVGISENPLCRYHRP